MKFDLIVGNPPYGSHKPGAKVGSGSSQLYTRIIRKCMGMNPTVLQVICPNNFTSIGKHQLKKVLLNSGRLSHLTAIPRDAFNVGVEVCQFIYDTNHNPEVGTIVTDEQGNTKVMDLRHVQAVFMRDLTQYPIIDAVLNYGGTTRMDSLYIRGDASLGVIDADLSDEDNHVKIVRACGGSNPMKISQIKPGVEMTGYGKHKVCMQFAGNKRGVSASKVADKDLVGGGSVIFLTADSAEEAVNMNTYIRSKLVLHMAKYVKVGTVNSKGFFHTLPILDFSRSWTDEDLYKEFSLSPEQIAMIEKDKIKMKKNLTFE